MITNLYPHNQSAYDAIMKHYANGYRKAAIVHATGTGKSYVIGSVAANFKRVLIIAPNNFVLDETRKVCHDGCEFRTYASVMYNEGDADSYDLIVLDEFHRGGAEKWGEGVNRLIEANPNALLLGTSATHIRYLDNQRNMADELFDGNIVSQLPLKDAIEQHILPNPTYVSSIYTMDETIRKRKERLESGAKKGVDKEEICRKLDGIAHNWENAGGVPSIIRKYFTHDMQRIIVFCSKVARAAEARKLLSRWFGLAGFNRVRYYNIDYKETRLEREMADFQEPLGEYDLKVAISVNMLNEGVHIPHVDGVIMLRSTVSRIIIEQQVGRCLTSNNSTIVPVVLDLVNNMDMIQYDEPIFTGEFSSLDMSDKKKHKHNGFPFKVIDECRDMRILLKQLDKEMALRKDYNTLLAEFDSFCEKEKRLPLKHSFNNRETRLGVFYYYHKEEEQVEAIINKYGIEKPIQKTIQKTIDVQIDEIEEFCVANNRIPSDGIKEERPLYLFMYKNKKHPRVSALYDKYCKRKTLNRYNAIPLLKSFCDKHNRLPRKCNDKFECRLGNWINHHKTDEFVVSLVEKYGRLLINPQNALCNFIDFVNKNNRLPTSSKEDTLYAYMRRNMDKVPEVIEIVKKYRYVVKERNDEDYFKSMLAELTKFCEEHNRNPFRGDEDSHIFEFMRNNRKNPEVKAVIDKYKKSKSEIAKLRKKLIKQE